jgi:hypothetical protein
MNIHDRGDLPRSVETCFEPACALKPWEENRRQTKDKNIEMWGAQRTSLAGEGSSCPEAGRSNMFGSRIESSTDELIALSSDASRRRQVSTSAAAPPAVRRHGIQWQ